MLIKINKMSVEIWSWVETPTQPNFCYDIQGDGFENFSSYDPSPNHYY